MQIDIPRRRVMLEAIARGIASPNPDTVVAALGLLAAMKAHPAFEHSLGGQLTPDEVMSLVHDQLNVLETETLFGEGRADVAGEANDPINFLASCLLAHKEGRLVIVDSAADIHE